MTNIAKGTVTYVGSKTARNGKDMFSFKLTGYDEYFRVGFFEDPGLKKGDIVEVAYNDDEKWGRQVKKKDINVTGFEAPKPSGKSSGGFSKGGGGRDKYWEDKDKYDKTVRQPVIVLQAAHKAAIQLAGLALQNGVLSLGNKKNKNELLEAYITEYRNRTYEEYMAHINLLESQGIDSILDSNEMDGVTQDEPEEEEEEGWDE